MIIERNMKVTPEELYDFMIESVQDQVYNTFGKEIPLEKIKAGYSHKTRFTSKKDGSSRMMKYSITKAVPGKAFCAVYSSVDRKSITSYKMEPADGGCHVIYEQRTDFYNEGEKPKGIGGKIDQFVLEKRLASDLKKLEKAVIKAR